MKSFLAIVLMVLLGVRSPGFCEEPTGPESELVGEVRNVLSTGILVKGTSKAPGETWAGFYILKGHPKENVFVIGDTLQRVVGQRDGKAYGSGGTAYRVYQFVRTGPLVSPPSKRQPSAEVPEAKF